MDGIDMAASLDAALADADAILLLVKHRDFARLDPAEIAARTKARIVVDCVNGWDPKRWASAGFKVFRLGVNK
jgi:UDP-N-acetyl-D-mannosaminuronate dehydrogenase